MKRSTLLIVALLSLMVMCSFVPAGGNGVASLWRDYEKARAADRVDEMENALELAEKTYVNVNIHQKEHADKVQGLAQLPDSCSASADCLEKQRAIFEKYNVFSPAMIDGILARLRSYNDSTLRKEIDGNNSEMLKLVKKYFHCG